MKTLPTAGRSELVDPEAALSWHSDAVLAWPPTSGRVATVRGSDVITLPISSKPLSKARLEIWRILGRLSDNSERADALLSTYLQKKRALQAVLKNVAEHPRVLLVMGGYDRGIWLGSAGMSSWSP